jgi:hypothetical protein
MYITNFLIENYRDIRFLARDLTETNEKQLFIRTGFIYNSYMDCCVHVKRFKLNFKICEPYVNIKIFKLILLELYKLKLI